MNKDQLNEWKEKFMEDANAIITASILTIALVGLMVVYMFVYFTNYPHIGELAGLYILFNLVLLCGFIYRRSRGVWTLEMIGSLVHNMYEFIKLRGD